MYFSHRMVYQICGVMMSISTWDRGCIFEYIFWTKTHYVTKLGQLIDISKDNSFQESFAQFGRLGGFPSLATCSNYSITSFAKISVFYFFEKVNKGQLKLVSTIFYQVFIFHQMIALKKLWKSFLFHLKSSFRSWDT